MEYSSVIRKEECNNVCMDPEVITLGEVNTTGSHACVGSEGYKCTHKTEADPQTQGAKLGLAEVWGN